MKTSLKDLYEKRLKINELDLEIQRLLDARFELSKEIGVIKKSLVIDVNDSNRQQEIIDNILNSEYENAELIGEVYECIFIKSKQLQC